MCLVHVTTYPIYCPLHSNMLQRVPDYPNPDYPNSRLSECLDIAMFSAAVGKGHSSHRSVGAGLAGPAAAGPIFKQKSYYEFIITASPLSTCSSSLMQSRLDDYRTARSVTPTGSSLSSFPEKFHPVKTYTFP